MMMACLARVHNKAEEVTLNHCLDIALTAADNLDVVTLEFVLCTLTHVACEHHLDAHSLHVCCDTRLATATLRRVKA